MKVLALVGVGFLVWNGTAIWTYDGSTDWWTGIGVVTIYLWLFVAFGVGSGFRDHQRYHNEVVQQIRNLGYWVEVTHKSRLGTVVAANRHNHGPDQECTFECGPILF